MKKILSGICFLLICSATMLPGQQVANNMRVAHMQGKGQVITPASGVLKSEEVGQRMRTHFKVFAPEGVDASYYADQALPAQAASGLSKPLATPPYYMPQSYYAETPQSLACLYGLTTYTSYCNPTKLAKTAVATTGSKAIAIVDAYDYPTAAADLQAYSTWFGLPNITSKNFTKVGQTGTATLPKADPNCAISGGWSCWASEAALDIEMAHALAPNAKIILVEANSNQNSDLFAAVQTASKLVVAAGGGEVSMSWGGGESSGETAYDKYMNTSKVVYFASTGDSWGTEYPSVSPNVVAVGGTTVMRSPSTLNYEGQVAWEDGGGGVSDFEARPSYQAGIASLIGSYRGVPDVAAIANPRTGVWVYDSYYTVGFYTWGGWNIFGGTSVASPVMAALSNSAGHFFGNSVTELGIIYGAKGASPNWVDITYGNCGFYDGWLAKKGWDPCTGFGAPYGKVGK